MDTDETQNSIMSSFEEDTKDVDDLASFEAWNI
jgi:hypothetical protein